MSLQTVLKERDDSTIDSRQSSDGPDADGTSIEYPIIEVPFDIDIQLSLPATATPAEVAALASCLSVHLRDEQLAAQAASQPEYVDGWSLAGRYGCRSPADLPESIKRGEEWQMSARVGRGR